MPLRDRDLVVGGQDDCQDRRQEGKCRAGQDGLSLLLAPSVPLIEVVKSASEHRRCKAKKLHLQLAVDLFAAVPPDIAAERFQLLSDHPFCAVGSRLRILLEADLPGQGIRGLPLDQYRQDAVHPAAMDLFEDADLLHAPYGLLIFLRQDDDQVV